MDANSRDDEISNNFREKGFSGENIDTLSSKEKISKIWSFRVQY